MHSGHRAKTSAKTQVGGLCKGILLTKGRMGNYAELRYYPFNKDAANPHIMSITKSSTNGLTSGSRPSELTLLPKSNGLYQRRQTARRLPTKLKLLRRRQTSHQNRSRRASSDRAQRSNALNPAHLMRWALQQ